MYTLTRILPARALMVEQLPALGGAFVIAEAFYKFHSFALECLAFLATWYALDFAVQSILGRRRSSR
jgi:hypothetical protein